VVVFSKPERTYLLFIGKKGAKKRYARRSPEQRKEGRKEGIGY